MALAMARGLLVVAVLVISAASARFVNLAGTQMTNAVPMISTSTDLDLVRREGIWKLFDGKKRTSWSVSVNSPSFTIRYEFEDEVKLRGYKIIIHSKIERRRHPVDWILTASGGSRASQEFAVTGARFREGKFVVKLPTLRQHRTYTFKFTEDRRPQDPRLKVGLSEIKLIGKLKQFSDMFPVSGYPCQKPLRVIDPPNGPVKQYFWTKGSNKKSMTLVRDIFAHRENVAPIKFVGPYVILGAIFEQPTEVLEFIIRTESGNLFGGGFRLQGSFCEPNCNGRGSEGWTTIARATGKEGRESSVGTVDKPDNYKAYRIKIFRKMGDAQGVFSKNGGGTVIKSITFLGCERKHLL